tara:strand:+ start:15917 stop:17077 length:1161 start_codon:yes stop_codon:yes gene_type:complete
VKKNLVRSFLIFQFIFVLSACSSLDGLRFWNTDEVDPDEPRELEAFSNKKIISLEWSKSFSGKNEIGNFEPDFSSNKIFFADTDGSVYSIQSENGEQNWSSELNFLSSGVAAAFGIIVVADIDGNVIALNQNDGTVIWTQNVKGEVLSKVAIDAKIVVVKTGSGELLGLDKDNGSIKWSYRSKLPTLTVRGSSSPVIVDDKVYVSFDNGRLAVFELDSGYLIWDGAISYVSGTSELENLIDSDSNPLVEGGLVYTTNYQGKLNIFDTTQRRSIWSYDISSFYSPIVIRGMLIVVESNSSLKSFSMQTLEESWSSQDYLNRNLSNAVGYKGNLIFGDLDGYIHIIDPLNGITVGRKKITKHPIKSIFSRSNNLYVVDESFNLFSINL